MSGDVGHGLSIEEDAVNVPPAGPDRAPARNGFSL